MRRTGRLERAGDWLNQHPGTGLAGLIVFYLAIVFSQAALKLIWADELITFYIAQQPGLGGIWRALADGADPNPPLMHILVKASTAVLGDNALGLRLPAILSVLLAIVCIWWMLRRWAAPSFALAGTLAFMATRGFDYAYDARSYAPMMGFAMLSLALWIASGDQEGLRRAAAIAGVTFVLAAGISANYYCVLAFFPIALGEFLRQRTARHFRFDIWFALVVAALPLLAYLPLIHHNIAEFAPHAWNRPHPSTILWSYLELVEGMFWPVLALAFYTRWRSRTQTPPSTNLSSLSAPFSAPSAFRFLPVPTPELAALAVVLLYPFLGFAIAVAGAGMISPRCVAPVCCAFGLAAGLLTARVFAAKPRAAATILLILLLWVTVRESICGAVLLEQRHAFLRLRDKVAGVMPTHPILVGDSAFVLPLYFYSDEAIARKISFPIDFEQIHSFEQDDSGEQNLWAGRDGVFPFAIASLKTLQRGSDETVIARPDGWLAHALRETGQGLTMDGEQEVYWSADWYRLGGVFTPMAHPETRILRSTKASR